MSKLLHKPFKAFTIYALIILISSIPVYYFVVDFIWLKELDEHNHIMKERIVNGMSRAELTDAELNNLLKNWTLLQPGTDLSPAKLLSPKPDSTYTVNRYNLYVKPQEMDRFRGLSSYIQIKGRLYHLQIETNVEEANETILAITLVTLLFFILLVTGFILLNRRIARKIWQPFRHTLEKLRSFDLTEGKTVQFDKTDIEEFSELNGSLQRLITDNVSAYTAQKAFIENASHELQTPLAVLKSKMDLLLQNGSITHEQSEILSAMALPLSRISRINKNLLLLAKIENNQYADRENLTLIPVIAETLELLDDYIVTKQIKLIRYFPDDIQLNCNKTLLEILISNLLINGIIHNTQGGILGIEFSGGTLTVRNSGSKPLDETALFKRFALSSGQTMSSGLGLAIIKEICSRYHWQVQYRFENQFHHFFIRF